MAKKVLIVCTSCDKLGDTNAATGCWVEELAAPYWVFTGKGYDVKIVSIKGGEIPFDEASLNPPFLTKEAEKFVLDDTCMDLITNTAAVDSVNFEEYDAVFLPGGHGVCYDLPENATLQAGLAKVFDAGKVVSAVCHGPVGLVNVKSAVSGEPIVKGKKVTGFTNSEERAVAKDDLVPFLLEDRLKELGGVFESVDNWQPKAVRDGNLVTGQNPGSSHATALLVVEALEA